MLEGRCSNQLFYSMLLWRFDNLVCLLAFVLFLQVLVFGSVGMLPSLCVCNVYGKNFHVSKTKKYFSIIRLNLNMFKLKKNIAPLSFCFQRNCQPTGSGWSATVEKKTVSFHIRTGILKHVPLNVSLRNELWLGTAKNRFRGYPVFFFPIFMK